MRRFACMERQMRLPAGSRSHARAKASADPGFGIEGKPGLL